MQELVDSQKLDQLVDEDSIAYYTLWKHISSVILLIISMFTENSCRPTVYRWDNFSALWNISKLNAIWGRHEPCFFVHVYNTIKLMNCQQFIPWGTQCFDYSAKAAHVFDLKKYIEKKYMFDQTRNTNEYLRNNPCSTVFEWIIVREFKCEGT